MYVIYCCLREKGTSKVKTEDILENILYSMTLGIQSIIYSVVVVVVVVVYV